MSASSAVAALASGFPRAVVSNIDATFGAALHTLQVEVGPSGDAELDALALLMRRTWTNFSSPQLSTWRAFLG
jgi:hypothetical protein